jgi:ABC-type Zn uptake system ZnuABC Zn-binding protein ZnuA
MRVLLALLSLWPLALPARGEPLAVCASVPSLGELARVVGGEDVEVTVFAKPGEDPHFIDPRPSFVRALSRADALVFVGMDLELGWLPPLVQNARNARVLPGSTGYIDASTVVTPLGIPPPGTTRLAGDVHRYGNPHFLVDPVQGLRVARLLRGRFAVLRPDKRVTFDERLADLERRIGEDLFGTALAGRYEVEKLARLQELGKLDDFLASQGELEQLGGWSARVLPHTGVAAVADHNLWPYFARRFGLSMIGYLEPKAGVPPTTRHLTALIALMRDRDAQVILTAPYFPSGHAELVARETGARIAHVAHEVGAYPGTESYLGMVNYNVEAVEAALGEGR